MYLPDFLMQKMTPTQFCYARGWMPPAPEPALGADPDELMIVEDGE